MAMRLRAVCACCDSDAVAVVAVNIVYFGTPEVAVPPLQALCRAGHEVVLVVTRPPKRRGRGGTTAPSPVAEAAADLGLAVTSDLSEARHVEADLGVVVAYGEHIGDAVLERRRTVNLHFSLLPRWRGAAPVERAMLAGDTETGVCLMDVASELDAGAVYVRRSTPIGSNESADELRARLCEMGVGLLLEAVTAGFGDPVPQSGEPTWAHKISPSELRIDWTAPAEHVLRLVRVGGAWTTLQDRRIKVLQAELVAESESPPYGTISLRPSSEGSFTAGAMAMRSDGTPAAEAGPDQIAAAGTISLMQRSHDGPAVRVATGRGILELMTVQSEGRAAAPARDWINGARITGGERFDQ